MFGVQVMAALIPEHYASPRNIANAFEALGKPGLAAYIAGKLPETKQIRSGDLGEIFATEWINARSNGYKTPIKDCAGKIIAICRCVVRTSLVFT